MADLLKNMYNRETLTKLAADIKAAYTTFEAENFVSSIMDETWDGLELKARGRKITLNLGMFLPQDYRTAIGIIDTVVANYGDWRNGGFCLYFPDFVEVYGQNEADWDVSMAALAQYTLYASAEFAVRPFIINHEERMMAQMREWANHENEGVRRLASEGCRPALPWGQALNSFKKDPSPILPILEQLKTDPDLYVRKSVANNLNDISKTHPELVAQIAKDWYGKNEHTDWIIKHGCRTLLKKGNTDVLAIFGFHNADAVEVSEFTLGTPEVSIGGDLEFSFSVKAKESTKVRLEYGIDYVKANGKRNRKIFQISEFAMRDGDIKNYTKKHSFADLSTRRHYPGVHAIALVVNGTERVMLEFEVTE